jgi:general stress protein 26
MFEKKVDELFQSLGPNQIMVLATSANNKVTARSMSFIIDNGRLYFQTDKNFCKYEQMKINPNVAVCYNNIQIEGICKEIGHPLDESNNTFALKYKEYFSGSYDTYSNLPSETAFEITPTLITIWGYEEGKPYREFYEFSHEKYHKDYIELC